MRICTLGVPVHDPEHSQYANWLQIQNSLTPPASDIRVSVVLWSIPATEYIYTQCILQMYEDR